jgi:hypothetical protein
MTGEGIRAGQQRQQRATPSTCTVLTNIISILKLGVLSLLPLLFSNNANQIKNLWSTTLIILPFRAFFVVFLSVSLFFWEFCAVLLCRLVAVC